MLRRLDCVLEPTKDKVLAKAKIIPKNADEKMRDVMLSQTAGQSFYNLSKFTIQSLLGDQERTALPANLNNYVAGFSANAWEIFLDKFKFGEQIARLDQSNLLFLVVSKFVEIDLHPNTVNKLEMGYIFEELKSGDSPNSPMRLPVNISLPVKSSASR